MSLLRPVRVIQQNVASLYCIQNRHYNSNSDDKNFKPNREHPVKRTLRILSQDFQQMGQKVDKFFSVLRNKPEENMKPLENTIPSIASGQYNAWQDHCDIAIIGGGIIGSSIAYWIKQRVPKAVNVVVIEKDPSYARAATTLSCGCLRQQFSLQENIEISQFGAQFLREANKRLHVEGHDPPDIQFTPQGFLFLASEQGAEQLQQNHRLQLDLGVKNKLLTGKQLKELFPWLNTDDVALGCLGMEKEGWFDPWSLLEAFKKKSISLGTFYVQGEAIGFEFKKQADLLMDGIEPGSFEGLETVVVRRSDGEVKSLKFGIAVLACGPNSGNVAEMARIGNGRGMLSVPLPVEPRKRYVYCIHCPGGPVLDLPVLIDHTGTYIRREGVGNNYICGRSPPEGELEPSTENFEVDYEFFENHVWPALAHRIPKMQSVKVKSSWAGHYDYNYFDQNAILGIHPYHTNLYIATGFSGHGLQQAPAIGRAVMEMIIDGGFASIDLSRFSFDRLLLRTKVLESNII